jgi:hypothetical protein
MTAEIAIIHYWQRPLKNVVQPPAALKKRMQIAQRSAIDCP